MEPKTHKNFGVATDGSEISHAALQLVLHEFMHPHDIVTVVSVTDKTKQYLRDEYIPANIFKTFKNDLITQLPSSRYKILMQERSTTKTDVKDDIAKALLAEKCDCVFMGAFGRKGPKLGNKGGQGADRETGDITGRTDQPASVPGWFIRSKIR